MCLSSIETKLQKEIISKFPTGPLGMDLETWNPCPHKSRLPMLPWLKNLCLTWGNFFFFWSYFFSRPLAVFPGYIFLYWEDCERPSSDASPHITWGITAVFCERSNFSKQLPLLIIKIFTGRWKHQQQKSQTPPFIVKNGLTESADHPFWRMVLLCNPKVGRHSLVIYGGHYKNFLTGSSFSNELQNEFWS